LHSYNLETARFAPTLFHNFWTVFVRGRCETSPYNNTFQHCFASFNYELRSETTPHTLRRTVGTQKGIAKRYFLINLAIVPKCKDAGIRFFGFVVVVVVETQLIASLHDASLHAERYSETLFP